VPHLNPRKERREIMSKVESGQNVSIHYVGTFDDGTEFDSSRSRGEALSFQVGSGQLISGFDDAVTGMEVGETKSVHLEPQDAYGHSDSSAVHEVSRDAFPSDFVFKVGATVIGQNEAGEQLIAKVNSLADDFVTLDFNHPMADKSLNFKIELLSINL
tara:strand:- start:47 stop:520 length:474 start_codon:yes stop_codon:yes gene_type:complete